MQMTRLAGHIYTVLVLRCDFQYQEMLDEVHVEVDSDWAVHTKTEVDRRGSVLEQAFAGQLLLATAHDIARQRRGRTARGRERCGSRTLHSKRAFRPWKLKTVVRVGTHSSAAAGITQRLGAGRVRHVEMKDLWIQEQVRSPELKISRVKSEENRAHFPTTFLERHHKVIKLLPLSVPGTRRGLANSVALGWCARCYHSEQQQAIRLNRSRRSRRCQWRQDGQPEDQEHNWLSSWRR